MDTNISFLLITSTFISLSVLSKFLLSVNHRASNSGFQFISGGGALFNLKEHH